MFATNQNLNTTFAPGQHRIQREGFGFTRALSNDDLMKIAPAIFADAAHASRSARYGYVSTVQLVDSLRAEGFLPVSAKFVNTKDSSKDGFQKHMMRFRRAEQLEAAEAREVILVNSHDGSSQLELMAGIYRMVCSNGLILGSNDFSMKVRHNVNAVDNVIEGAYHIVKDFDKVGEQIEGMKAVKLERPLQIAYANAALAMRYEDVANCGVKPEALILPKRTADAEPSLWNTFNVVQERMIQGGIRGWKKNANGQTKRGTSRAINGISQNVAINRGLWTLAEEMRKAINA